jgi:dTDP-4-amino-4,6-dideoxygalactose transaminase
LRFNEIQAAIGIKQLEKLPQWNEARRKIAKMYNDSLENSVVTPIEASWARHVYHVYVIRSEKRDKLMEFLKLQGVSTLVHYPVPIHKQPAITSVLGAQHALETTEKMAKEVLSIPMHPKLTKNEVAYVSDKIKEFAKSH